MNYHADIPLSVAIQAHDGTSHDPEQRGAGILQDYAETLAADLAMLEQYADTEEKRATLAVEFARYRTGYQKRMLDYLRSRSGLMSSFITGPANFPVRRMEKKHLTVEKRLNELVEYRKRALDAIKKTLRPELRPIMAGDADATERLREKIKKAEAEHATMKQINAAHKAFLKTPASLDVAPLSDEHKQLVRSYKPAYSWEPHPIAPYQLTNLSANIRNMKKRMEGIEQVQAEPERTEERANARLEDAPTDNRIRLFFPGIPESAVRSALKSNGFRWTPSLGCWQAYRNPNSLRLAAEIAGKERAA